MFCDDDDDDNDGSMCYLIRHSEPAKHWKYNTTQWSQVTSQVQLMSR